MREKLYTLSFTFEAKKPKKKWMPELLQNLKKYGYWLFTASTLIIALYHLFHHNIPVSYTSLYIALIISVYRAHRRINTSDRGRCVYLHTLISFIFGRPFVGQFSHGGRGSNWVNSDGFRKAVGNRSSRLISIKGFCNGRVIQDYFRAHRSL